jgi:hypothetical protein
MSKRKRQYSESSSSFSCIFIVVNLVSGDISVQRVDTDWKTGGQISIPDMIKNFLFTLSILTSGLAYLPIRWVERLLPRGIRRPGRVHSSPASAELWSYNPTRMSYKGVHNYSYLSTMKTLLMVHLRLPLWSSGQSSCLQIQSSGFDSRRYQVFWETVCLERGPLSLTSTTEELLERKSSDSGLESREYGRRSIRHADHVTLYICKSWH